METAPAPARVPGSHLDRYAGQDGTLYLTGVQALVRLAVDQHIRDTNAGLRTATFISGYEGSPLAGYDLELGRHRDLLADHDIVHEPAVNEDIAATAVHGSQLASARADSRYDGVVGIWYGKAPGLDRSCDAIRHGNLMGSDHRGGVLALVGDDPVAKSSTVPSASELTLAGLLLPTVYPADSQEILDLGSHAIAMSRACGLWTAMKLVTNVAEGASVVQIDADRLTIRPPDHPAAPYRHEIASKLLGKVSLDAERNAYQVRLELAKAYARANGLNRIVCRSGDDRIGIVAAGKTYVDVRQALGQLGLDDAALDRHGIRLLKLGMVFPVEPEIVREFADGLSEIVVVEEKRSFLESAVKDVLYGVPGAPAVVGKRKPDGTELFPQVSELDPDLVAPGLADRLGDVATVRLWRDRRRPATIALPMVPRTPVFCSGCPHSRSTRVAEGTLVGAGSGCHGMVLMMDPARVGDVTGVTQMGGEGAQWLGMAPFLDRDHLVQNIGDGTFYHSASMVIRAAVAAGVTMTFKILYNSAVAMTGGQQAVGQRSVPQLTELLAAEGVTRIVVTTDDTRRYRRARMARGTTVLPRERLDEAQRTLAGIEGVTVLIHDQECAAEKRRKRRRATERVATPQVMINERVCEGCGDCGSKSGCTSLWPVDTEFGRKTRVHQPWCNEDFSCLDGDCPAFVSVVPGRRPPAELGPRISLPDPIPCTATDDVTIRVAGIGGTGVVTVAQILAVAAYQAGKDARTLDQTGVAQKGGAVVSDIKITKRSALVANKMAAGECDLYLGCDLLVASDPRNLVAGDPERTVAVVSTTKVPTGAMIVDRNAAFPDTAGLVERIDAATRRDRNRYLDAREITEQLFGDDQYANIFLLGAAFQTGALPLPAESIEEAIRLNGVAVATNLTAFARGRQSVADPSAFAAALASPRPAVTVHPVAKTVSAAPDSELARLVDIRATELVAYQNAAYARRYTTVVERVLTREREAVGSTALAEAVATNLYKLMAYKDEYEVARLSLDPALTEQVRRQFGPDARYALKFHPPVLRALGLRKKLSLGRWFRPALWVLRAMRVLRGTPFDVFGHTKVRRVERELITEYLTVVDQLVTSLTPDNHHEAVTTAALPDMIRGYEEVKLAAVAEYREQLAKRQA
jgi:indolepyruvate ferredoxin oxidoreductase